MIVISTFIVQFIMMALMSAVIRAVIGALIGSIRLHKNTNIINIIVISITTLFISLGMYSEPTSMIKNVVVTLITGICVFLFFQYSDKREARKNIKREANKYMKDDFFDSL